MPLTGLGPMFPFGIINEATTQLIFNINMRKKHLKKSNFQLYLKSHSLKLNLLCKFIEIALGHECSPVNLLYIFKNTFLKEHLRRAACVIANSPILNIFSGYE